MVTFDQLEATFFDLFPTFFRPFPPKKNNNNKNNVICKLTLRVSKNNFSKPQHKPPPPLPRDGLRAVRSPALFKISIL